GDLDLGLRQRLDELQGVLAQRAFPVRRQAGRGAAPLATEAPVEEGEVLRFLRATLVVETLAGQPEQLDEQVPGRHGRGRIASSLGGNRDARRRTGAADVLQ